MKSLNWFEVDRQGLKQLQLGKPKHYVLRELIQNAWDEEVKEVYVTLAYASNLATISVEDDNPEGFKDLRDSYTLFKETAKRKDPEKRGRFNLGEKQAFVICRKATISTTKGTIVFDSSGRRESTKHITALGSKVTVELKMSKTEYDEALKMLELYLVPKSIKFYINGKEHFYKQPLKTFETSLLTEMVSNGMMRQTTRKTKVDIYKSSKSYLYELGIPVVEIDCEYSIDVQQRVPLSVDRENVSQSYLRDLFSEVLNQTYNYIREDVSSEQWIRQGMSDVRISEEAVQTIVEKRYGEKVCIASPNDPNSIDDAISKGYRVLRGNELSKDEWGNIKKFDCIESSSSLFGSNNFKVAKRIEPNEQQQLVGGYAKKLAKRLLKIDIDVEFISNREMRFAAEFGDRLLTFNVAKLGKRFFENPMTTTGLILHEIAHSKGNHTEHSYHECLTAMAQELVLIALEEPEFFKEANTRYFIRR